MTHERTRKRNKQRASEMNLAAILLCIVILFLICHFPRILLNVHEFFMLDDMILCGEHGIGINHIIHFANRTFSWMLIKRLIKEKCKAELLTPNSKSKMTNFSKKMTNFSQKMPSSSQKCQTNAKNAKLKQKDVFLVTEEFSSKKSISIG